MQNSFEQIELRGGGVVAVSEYGSPSGAPVFFCHGWPSSRTMAELTDAAARELNLRIISPDRPGIRNSTLQRARKLLDWPPLLEELADRMSIREFRVLGISGGAPYALAAGWAMPERVRAVAVVSSAPPITELADRNGLLPLYRWMLFFYPRHRELLRYSFHVARPFLSVKVPLRFRPLLLKLLQPCDANVMRDIAAFEACFESQRQAWRASADGLMMQKYMRIRGDLTRKLSAFRCDSGTENETEVFTGRSRNRSRIDCLSASSGSSKTKGIIRFQSGTCATFWMI